MNRTSLRSPLTILLLSALATGCHRRPPTTPAPQKAFWNPGQLPRWRPRLTPTVQKHIPWPVPSPWGGGLAPTTSRRGEGAAAYARAQLGKRYCWGGTGPACYDCSGLTSEAWRHAGQPIPRTSGAQRRRLPPVSMAALAVGDILWRPGHVGIYVGNGWAIHAPGRRKPIQYQRAVKFREAHRPPSAGLRVVTVR